MGKGGREKEKGKGTMMKEREGEEEGGEEKMEAPNLGSGGPGTSNIMLVMKFCTVWHSPVGRPSSDLFLEARPGRDKLFGRLALLGAPAPQTPQLSCGAGAGVPGNNSDDDYGDDEYYCYSYYHYHHYFYYYYSY